MHPRWTGPVLVAESLALRNLTEWIAVLANSDNSVLITGERGAGKELVARTIHARGPRREGPLVVLDGDVLADRIVAEDATWRNAWLQGAASGTLVLDGIEKLSLRAQALLLREIDEPWARPRCSRQEEPGGVRLITLSRDGLSAPPSGGHFLESLRYRLKGVRLHVPPLRDRGEDLRPLAAQLLRELTSRASTPPALSPAVWDALSRYPYPGNVRELRWILERAVAMADGGPIDVAHLPAEVVGKR